jgi:hypothetical protein
MKNKFKKIFKGLLIFISFMALIFWLWYYLKVKQDLTNYNIPEKLVVKFENDNNNYLVNLNDWSYSKYNWKYNIYWYNFEFSTWSETTEHDEEIFNRKIYNKNNTYYFDYNLRVYNKNNKEIYKLYNSVFFEAYWSIDWKYIIARDWYIVRDWYITRIIWLLFPTETTQPIITIIDPITYKIRQLPILNNKWWYESVETILWYVN